MINIYNTLSRKKEIFRPINDHRVKLFVCGPTVYDHAHIGHARTYISFDLIARYLRFKGYTVFYLQNITDIDDKIIKRADELGMDPIELAREFENKYLKDMAILGVETVTLYARATEHLPEIFKQIEELISKGFAYETAKGVYFDESKYPDFGKLSNRKIEDLKVHRIKTDHAKKNPGDFALWKKKDKYPSWNSPWGKGRPGWHIEDTAITEEYFGPQYDIHGGGLDLIFPHHEAEIAQMESASGKKPMVRYWMHTGFLNVKGEKMSKSLGNFITIKDLLEEYSPDVFRFFVLSTHYSSPIDFSEDILQQSVNSLKKIRKFLETINELLESEIKESTENDNFYNAKIIKSKKRFFEAMDNDFNSPIALSSIFELIREVYRDLEKNNISKKSLNDIKYLMFEFGEILGISFDQSKNVINNESELSGELLEIIIEIRQKLREKKDWDLSDEIRNRLSYMDIFLED